MENKIDKIRKLEIETLILQKEVLADFTKIRAFMKSIILQNHFPILMKNKYIH